VAVLTQPPRGQSIGPGSRGHLRRRGDSADAGMDLGPIVIRSVAPYKRIRSVRFVDAIPRTPAGKILRRVLVDDERLAV
jgi:acyl-CoA synthetase (AMP-forming)/AMP-acid ligase II